MKHKVISRLVRLTDNSSWKNYSSHQVSSDKNNFVYVPYYMCVRKIGRVMNINLFVLKHCLNAVRLAIKTPRDRRISRQSLCLKYRQLSEGRKYFRNFIYVPNLCSARLVTPLISLLPREFSAGITIIYVPHLAVHNCTPWLSDSR